MTTEKYHISVSGLKVEVVRKPIKNLHLGVYPPHGRVRVAVPFAVTNDSVRLAVISKLGWIKRQKARFEKQARQSQREMVSGESHYFLGTRFRLNLLKFDAASKVVLRHNSILDLHVRPRTSAEKREQALQRWYREQLRVLVPPLLEKWQPVLGVQVAQWRIKKMKTKWGSCNMDANRIWLNLELAKKPPSCLEYILVHELVHLLERHHNDRFREYMDRFMPQWRLHREELNQAPLSHERWSY
jgi:predicted metal-dependent hydrolase